MNNSFYSNYILLWLLPSKKYWFIDNLCKLLALKFIKIWQKNNINKIIFNTSQILNISLIMSINLISSTNLITNKCQFTNNSINKIKKIYKIKKTLKLVYVFYWVMRLYNHVIIITSFLKYKLE